METQCEELVNECQSLECENEKQEVDIATLRKEIRQKQQTLATFEMMLLNAAAAKRGEGSDLTEKENNKDDLNVPGFSQKDQEGEIPMRKSF